VMMAVTAPSTEVTVAGLAPAVSMLKDIGRMLCLVENRDIFVMREKLAEIVREEAAEIVGNEMRKGGGQKESR
jgi:low affinity Fe/Cu permease